jgi:cysteinyl-tRNA synthetase
MLNLATHLSAPEKIRLRDELRAKILELGVEVKDTPSGQTWEWR